MPDEPGEAEPKGGEFSQEVVLPAAQIAQLLMAQPSEYECYADQTIFGMSTYTFNMIFGLIGNTGPKNLATIRMSAEHAKVFAIMLKRTILQWEEKRGTPIMLPQSTLTERHINLETDW